MTLPRPPASLCACLSLGRLKGKKNINRSGKPLKGRLGKETERESKKKREEKIMR